MSVLSLAPMLLPLVGAALVILMARRGSRAPKPSAAIATGEGSWRAKRLSVGGLMNVGRWGVMRVSGGTVSFTPDDESEPAWSVPADRLAVAPGDGVSPGRIRLTGADPEPTTYDITASKGPGMRSAGDVRQFRDGPLAAEFQEVLLRWGARRG